MCPGDRLAARSESQHRYSSDSSRSLCRHLHVPTGHLRLHVHQMYLLKKSTGANAPLVMYVFISKEALSLSVLAALKWLKMAL